MAPRRQARPAVEVDDFQQGSLFANGHIELTKAVVTAVAIVTPAIRKSVVYMGLPAYQPAGERPIWAVSGNYNLQDGRRPGA